MKKPILFSVFVFVAAGLLGAPSANAGCDSKSCTGQIKRLYLDDKTLYTGIEGNLGTLKCTPVSKIYITVPVNHPVFREWHGMLLGAFLSGKPVTLRTTETGPCSLLYVIMDK